MTSSPIDFKALARKIDSWLEQEFSGDSRTEQMCLYAVVGGGKRFRPALSLIVAEQLGLSADKVRNIALAIELVHAFSLVHDDLPALDNDSERRGKPSLHVKYGEAEAILIGDFLLAKAFTLLAGEGKQVINLISGVVCRLCEGQLADINLSKDSVVQDVLACYEAKTGALISAAVMAPALLAGGDSADGLPAKGFEAKQLGIFGQKLGLLFQVTDDILDSGGESEVSLLSFISLDEGRKLANDLAGEAKNAVAGRGVLEDLVDFVHRRVV